MVELESYVSSKHMHGVCIIVSLLASSQCLRGCAMSQAVNHWPLTMDSWVQSQASLCGIFGRQSGTWVGFFSEYFSVFPVV
jgi:hypothetical protein